MKCHLYNLHCYHLASGHRHRWHLATAPGYQSWSSDDPASVVWLPYVGQWASVTVTAAGESGGSRAAYDDLRLMNAREPDDMQRFASVYDETAGVWLRVPLGDARPLNPLVTDYVIQAVEELDVEDDAPLASAVLVWRAKAGVMPPGGRELRLPVWDRLVDFDTPILVETYAGTGGLEGPSTLAGTTRERCWGWCPIVAPTYLGVVGGKHTYSVNGGHGIEAIVRGWDKAAPYQLVTGTPSSSASPAQFSVDTATGILTIGGAKPEDFRVEVKGTKLDGVWPRYPGQIIAHLATRHGGIIAAADVAGMDALPRTVGLYLPAGDTTTHRAAYDKLAGGLSRGRWYIDTTDTLIATRLPRAATATPVRSYRTAAGETSGLQPANTTPTVPAKQVVLRYAPNASPSDQTAGAASADDAALWSRDWREVRSAENATIAAAWGTAAKVATIDSQITLAADAQAELALWAEEKANPPRQFTLKANDGALGIAIGAAVLVQDTIAGFEDGAAVVVYGRTNRDRGGGATLSVER